MSRKFVTTRELAFVNAINRELIQHVADQAVFYYAISQAETQVDPLYRETVRKTWCAPVRVNARVAYDNTNTVSTGQGQDSRYTLEIYFHNQELVERNLVPREGDFVEFGQIFYEITSVTRPQLVFGQVNESLMTKCVCFPSREGQFQAGGDSSALVDNTHPVEDPEPDVR